ncbi:PRC-barrel domain-containing protein [Leucobacter massiliensis]|nr:PRC-barrel domain-containing protein [Leucobacter massiliensis]
MIDTTAINSLFDARVTGPDGERIGTVKQVYLDHDSGEPLFVTVATGLFGTSESFVPVSGAAFDGHVLHVSYDKATIKDAPRIDADGELTEAEEDRILDYYARAGAGSAVEGTGSGRVAGDAGSAAGTDTNARASHAEPANGPEAAAGEAVGRPRLRRYVIVEERIVTVPDPAADPGTGRDAPGHA